MALLKLEGQSTCNSSFAKLSAHKLWKKIRKMYWKNPQCWLSNSYSSSQHQQWRLPPPAKDSHQIPARNSSTKDKLNGKNKLSVRCYWLFIFNPRMVGKELKDHLISPPVMSRKTPPLSQAAPRPIQPALDYCLLISSASGSCHHVMRKLLQFFLSSPSVGTFGTGALFP